MHGVIMTKATDFDDIFIKWLEKFDPFFHNVLHKIMDYIKECIENNYEKDECIKKTTLLMTNELNKLYEYGKTVIKDVDNITCFCHAYATHLYNSKLNKNKLVYGKPPLEIAKKQMFDAWGNND